MYNMIMYTYSTIHMYKRVVYIDSVVHMSNKRVFTYIYTFPPPPRPKTCQAMSTVSLPQTPSSSLAR